MGLNHMLITPVKPIAETGNIRFHLHSDHIAGIQSVKVRNCFSIHLPGFGISQGLGSTASRLELGDLGSGGLQQGWEGSNCRLKVRGFEDEAFQPVMPEAATPEAYCSKTRYPILDPRTLCMNPRPSHPHLNFTFHPKP